MKPYFNQIKAKSYLRSTKMTEFERRITVLGLLRAVLTQRLKEVTALNLNKIKPVHPYDVLETIVNDLLELQEAMND